jgi:hypothetical protein
VSPAGADVFVVPEQEVTPAVPKNEWSELLSSFPSVTQPFSVQYNPAHTVEHALETSGRPHHGDIGTGISLEMPLICFKSDLEPSESAVAKREK